MVDKGHIMIATEWNDVYVEDDELIGMFPERFKGVEYDNIMPNNPVEMDSELGLEVVKNETILSKYGINLDPKNGFHASLQRFFDKTGYLTDKQLNCFN